MKFTPGPWMVFDLGSGLGICPADCENDLIPNISVVNNTIVKFKTPPQEISFDLWEKIFAQQKADALLMAAAPELLELVETLVLITVNAVDPNDFSEIRNKAYKILNRIKRGE